MNSKNKKDSVLEIGCEEIPAAFLSDASRQLLDEAQSELLAAGLIPGEIITYCSPRRLTLYLKDLPETNTPAAEEIIGPPLSIGLKDNQYTIAAKSFAQRYGATENDLKVKETPKGKYFYLSLREKPRPTKKILATLYPQIISRITFPKTMVWEETRFRFARPIRWLLALYDDQIIRFSLAQVTSGNCSRGLAPDYPSIKIPSARQYLTTLKNHNILVDPAERLAAIRLGLKDANRCLPEGWKIKIDENLLHEINYLVECPSAVVGKFPEKYQQLPAEIILAALRTKQKFFAVEKNEDGRTILSNFFVGIRNGPSLAQDNVRQGFERVLTARLEDGEFYFRQDRETRLIDKIPRLKEIALPAGLGTMADHIQRLKELARWLNQELSLQINIDKLTRAIDLCKADIVTGLVAEYPELQGIAGKIYARIDREEPTLALAIEQHYWPLTATSRLPETEFPALIALADKTETVVGYWLAGIKATGSTDPYGLRRAGTAILRIILHYRWKLSLQNLLQFVAGQFTNQSSQNLAELTEFFINRLEQLFLNENRYRPDTIRSVLKVRPLEVLDCQQRLLALEEARKSAEWESIETGFKRANNILRQAGYNKITRPTPELLETSAERELYQAIQKIQNLSQKTSPPNYPDFWKSFLKCRPLIDKFFNDVLVMDKREDIRQNRLALLASLIILTENIADLTQLGAGDKKV